VTAAGAARLLPQPDEDSAPFWDGCAAGELRVQRCGACGRRRMPPRPMCPSCRSLSADWGAMSGRGRIWSWVVAHPPLLEPYASEAPYVVAVVELDDDPAIRLVGNLVTRPGGPLGEIDPTVVEIGAAVDVCFAPPIDGIALPQWRLR
jgi:uncharacterized protein